MIQTVTVDCEPGGNTEMGGPVGHHRRSHPVTKAGCEPAWRCTIAAAGVVDVVRARHSWDVGSLLVVRHGRDCRLQVFVDVDETQQVAGSVT